MICFNEGGNCNGLYKVSVESGWVVEINLLNMIILLSNYFWNEKKMIFFGDLLLVKKIGGYNESSSCC